jgi:hypothetical protein
LRGFLVAAKPVASPIVLSSIELLIGVGGEIVLTDLCFSNINNYFSIPLSDLSFITKE